MKPLPGRYDNEDGNEDMLLGVMKKIKMQIIRRVAEGVVTGANAPALIKSCPLYLCPKNKSMKKLT